MEEPIPEPGQSVTKKVFSEAGFEDGTDYEDLIPDDLVSYFKGHIKLQIFTDDFVLNPETQFIVIKLDINLSWYNVARHFLTDVSKWSCVIPKFNKACNKICPELDKVFIRMVLNRNGKQFLDYNTKDLNWINNRDLTRYPWMPVKWGKNSFTTMLPVYFFKALEVEKPKRKFVLVS